MSQKQSIQTSKELDRQRKRNAVNANTDGVTNMSGQEAYVDSETQRAYKANAKLREENHSDLKSVRKMQKQGSAFEADQTDKEKVNPQKLMLNGAEIGETSGEEDDGDESDMGEFFQPDKKTGSIKASDGKIIFSHSSDFIKWWNNAVILLAMYNSITIPIAIFYADDGPTLIASESIALCDAVIDLIFLIDVILTFRTTYLDTVLGQEETDTHKIAARFLKGSFTIDFISSVPFAALIPKSQP